MVTVEKIFDRVLGAEAGECVAVVCPSFEDMERLRLQFYRELRKLRRAHRELTAELSISRKKEKDKWIVYLQKKPEIAPETVVFLGKDGIVEPFEKEEAENGTGERSTVGKTKSNRKKARKVTRDKS